jgi:hypothetical protein
VLLSTLLGALLVAIRPETISILDPSDAATYAADASGRGKVPIALAVHLNDHPSNYAVCIVFDLTPPQCLSVQDLEARTLTITNVLPGKRFVSCLLQNVSTGVVLASHHISFWISGGMNNLDITAVRSVNGTPPWQLDSNLTRPIFFDEIYSSSFWVTRDDPTSGPGSRLQATVRARQAIEDVISKFNIETMLDLPCGDLTWQMEIQFPQGFLDAGSYVGADISSVVITKNKGQFPVRFMVIDAVEGPQLGMLRIHGAPPQLIFCRHMVKVPMSEKTSH